MNRTGPFAFVRDLATRWDLIAAIVVIGLLAFATEASHGLFEPLAKLKATPMSLDPINLPFYAARTTLRMFAGLFVSLLFTLTYATWAAKSPRAEKLLVPILDILQSVPIFGFLSVTVVFFLSLVPGRVIGAEFAAIFVIFTSQAWNMAFSFYQSLRTVPYELIEAAETFHLTAWMRFWQLEVPFGLPALIWNVMMSMSGGWFFVVASEAVTVGSTTFDLPGIGSYIALASQQGNLRAIGWAILTIFLVILVCDQLIFRPLVVWVDRFRVEQEPGSWLPQSWALTMMMRSRIISGLTAGFYGIVRWTSWALPRPKRIIPRLPQHVNRRMDLLWFSLLVLVVAWAAWKIASVLIATTSWSEIGQVSLLACHRERHLDTDWRAHRAQSTGGGDRAADRAVSGRVPDQSAVPVGRVCDRLMETQFGHMAQSADDSRHSVVHPVQCDRGRHGDPERAQVCRRKLPRPGLVVVEAGGAACRIALLRDRCDHCLGRLVERRGTGRIRQLEIHDGGSTWNRRLY
jgi:ABC-type nitrate/sulfonate/bicarbonate transport system permease component